MRTFISRNAARGGLPLWNRPEPDGEEESPDGGEVVIFDGIESVRALLTKWYGEKSSEAAAAAMARADEEATVPTKTSARGSDDFDDSPPLPVLTSPTSIPEGVDIIEGSPIQDRGSSFIARVCRLSHPSQVRIKAVP